MIAARAASLSGSGVDPRDARIARSRRVVARRAGVRSAARRQGLVIFEAADVSRDARPPSPFGKVTTAGKAAASAALALGAFAALLAMPTHPAHAAASAVAAAPSATTHDLDPNLIRLPTPAKRALDAGFDRIAGEIRHVADTAKSKMKEDWDIEDVWVILLWNLAISKGRRVIFRALARFKESDKGKTPEELDDEFEKRDHFLRWLAGPMSVISNAMTVCYLNDVLGRVFRIVEGIGFIDAKGFDLGIYALAFGATSAMAVGRYFPRVLETKFHVTSVSLRSVLTRITEVIVVSASIAQAGILFGASAKAILGVGSVGGLAVGLASKEIISNVLGMMIISVLRPFDVGENIFIQQSGQFRGSSDPSIAEYNVRSIGWYSTVLVAKDTKPVTVPNGMFLSQSVINVTRQTHRVLVLNFRVRYEDRTHVPALIEDFEQYLTESESIDSDAHPIRVNVTANNADHLVLNVEAHAYKVDLTLHYKVRSKVLMDLMDLVEGRTGRVAYPTEVFLEHPLLSEGHHASANIIPFSGAAIQRGGAR